MTMVMAGLLAKFYKFTYCNIQKYTKKIRKTTKKYKIEKEYSISIEYYDENSVVSFYETSLQTSLLKTPNQREIQRM